MTRRELLEKCSQLYNELRRVEALNKQLTEEIATYKSNTMSPKAEYDDIINEKTEFEAGATIPKCLLNIDHAASVIGQIVVFAAEYSNKLTAGGNTEYRELVNLILGNTELQKAKILEIWQSELKTEEKDAKMDECLEEAIEYFDCVMAQMNGINDEKL